MEQHSFQAMLQDDKGDIRFHEKLVSLIKNKSRVKEITLILINANIWNSCDSSGNTLLHIAAQFDNGDLIEHLLLQSGSRIDVQNVLGKTPLIVAIENRSQTSAGFLIEANANVFISDNSGKNALHWFLDVQWSGHFALAQMILMRIESQCLGNSKVIAKKLLDAEWPLRSVVSLENLKVTKIILNRGEPIDARELSSGYTALHVAVINQDPKHVKFLLDNNADPNIEDNSHRTPLSYVYQNPRHADERVEIVQLLLDAGAALYTTSGTVKYNQVKRLLKYANRKVIEILFQANFELPIEYEQNDSSLHALVSNDSPDIYKIYVAHVALQKLWGVRIDEFVWERIHSDPNINDYFTFCKQRLIVRFHETLTLLDVLTLSDFDFERYVKYNQEFSSKIERFDNLWHVLHLYYFHTMLQNRYSKVVRLLELRKKAACHLCQFIKTDYSQYPSIVDQIINYLSEQDLENFLKVPL